MPNEDSDILIVYDTLGFDYCSDSFNCQTYFFVRSATGSFHPGLLQLSACICFHQVPSQAHSKSLVVNGCNTMR